MPKLIIRFWRKHDDARRLLAEVRYRYRESPPFARLFHAAVYTILHGGEVVIEGKANAQRVLRHVLRRLLEHEQAEVSSGKVGKWQYLKLTTHPYTKQRVWQKVSRARAWAHTIDAGTSDLPIPLMRLLGYPADVTRAQARLIEKAHCPRSIVIVDGVSEWQDTDYDLEPNDNQHFRDDRGWYDDAGVLRPHCRQQRERWEEAYHTKHEAWNRVREAEAAKAYRFGGRFYPARMWSKAYGRIDWHGAMRILELRDHLANCRQAVENLVHRQAIAPRRPKEAPWWSMSKRERETLQEAEELRYQKLKADDDEIAAHALADVPQSDLDLLEEEVAQTRGKAPKGLIAALAHERLAEIQRSEKVRQQQEGLAALEHSAQVAA